MEIDETHPTSSAIKLSHASQGHSSGVIDSEVVLAYAINSRDELRSIVQEEVAAGIQGDLNVGNSSPELVLIQEDMAGNTLVGNSTLNSAAAFLPDQNKLVLGIAVFVNEEGMEGSASYTVDAGMTRSIECSTIFEMSPWGAGRDTFIGWRIGDLVWNTAILYQNGGSSQFDIYVNFVVIKSVYYEIDPSGGQALIRWTYDPNTQRYKIFDGDTVVLDWVDPTIIEDKGEGGMFDIFGGTNNEDVMATADIFNIVLKNPESDPILGISDTGVNINGSVDINQKIIVDIATGLPISTSTLVIDSSMDNDETVL